MHVCSCRCTSSLPPSLICAHIHTYSDTHTHSLSLICTYTHSLSLTCTYTHNTHMYIHTHTHPHSQLSQVYTTFVNKTTGQLSLITSYLNWSGTAARIFTTMQETQDPIMLSMFITSFVLNSIIMVQFVMYWNTASNVAASTKKRSGSKKEKKDS